MACFIPCCTGWKTAAWCAAVGKRPTPAANGSIIPSSRLGVRLCATKKSNGRPLPQPSTKSGNLNMHNIDKLILEWRRKGATPNVSAETLDELETHLRETTEQLVRSGMHPPDAFQRALADLGNMPKIA